MRILPPEPQTETVIDYDITLACGRDIQFTVRPAQGDTEIANHSALTLFFARTKHHVKINAAQMAVTSRREREMVILPKPEPDAVK